MKKDEEREIKKCPNCRDKKVVLGIEGIYEIRYLIKTEWIFIKCAKCNTWFRYYPQKAKVTFQEEDQEKFKDKK